MWFKNALLYTLTQRLEITEESLREALKTKPARPCASQELATYGFSSAFGKHGEDLLHASNGMYLIAATKEERKVPSAFIKEALDAKVSEIQEQQQRKVGRKERDQLKDEIIQALLPRAFTTKRTTRAIIAPEQNWIIVDASNANAADDLLSTLREALGSLPVRPLSVKIAPSATLSEWLRSHSTEGAAPLPNSLAILNDCVLTDTHEDGGVINAKRQDLSAEEIQRLLGSGKIVTSLAMAWSDKLTFKMDDKLRLKGIRFGDLLQDQAGADSDDKASELDASFALMAGTFAEFLPQFTESLGGIEIPQGI